MTKYNLTPGQELIVSRLVECHNSGSHDGSFTWQCTFDGSRFELDGGARVEAEPVDLQAIERAGLLNVYHSDPGSATCTLTPAASQAHRTGFGVPPTTRLLVALHDLTGGTVKAVALKVAAKRAGLSEEKSQTVWMQLSAAGMSNGSRGEDGPEVFLTPAGISAIETPESEASAPHIRVDGNAVFQSAPGATANFDQRRTRGDAAGLAEQLQGLRQQAEKFQDQQITIARTLETLIQGVEAGKSQSAGFMEHVAKLAELVKPYVELGNNALEFVKIFGPPK